jgi:hypothetical protein
VRDFLHTCLFGWLSPQAATDFSDQATPGALAPRVRLHREFQNLIVQRGHESGKPVPPQVLDQAWRTVQQALTLFEDSRGLFRSDAGDLLSIS